MGTTARRALAPILALLAILLAPPLAAAQEFGLVLSGGGGKGAYEVGVWKALSEYGIAQKVTVISGTSVGGLNAALFAVAPVSTVEAIWRKAVPEHLVNEDDFIDGLIDEDGLDLIMRGVNFWSLRREHSSPKVHVTCTQSGFLVFKLIAKKLGFDGFSHRFLLNDESDEDEIRRKLLATSAFPVLTRKVRLSDGHDYVDGGASDNVPVEPMTQYADLSQVLVVYLKHAPESMRTKYPGINIVDITPSERMGGLHGTLDFSAEEIDRKIRLGYEDTKKILRGSGLNPVSEYWFY